MRDALQLAAEGAALVVAVVVIIGAATFVAALTSEPRGRPDAVVLVEELP